MNDKDYKVSTGTIIRTILFVLVLVNMILRFMNKPIIEISDEQLYELYTFVECAVSASIFIVGFWKNESFTENAIYADEILQNINDMKNNRLKE